LGALVLPVVCADDGATIDQALGGVNTEVDPSTGGDEFVESSEATKNVMTDEEKEALEASKETHQFQAEVSRMMDIIINSLYTQKEVFLREVISNSADALEKIRYLSVTDGAVLGDTRELDIRIEADRNEQTLTITDTGVGMTKQDLVNNLGTLAKSGTTNFLEALSGSGGDLSLIGQFGVGFYSTYLVSDRVTVVSKNNDDSQHIWESTADASFSVAEDPRGSTLGRGTKVILHMKDDATEFLSETVLKDLVNRFSQFIAFPIYLKVTKTITEEVPEDDAEEEEESEDGEEKKKKTKTISKEVKQWEQVNTQKAIWLRSKDEIENNEYDEFYKAIAKDWSPPLTYTHFSAEGEVEFKAILFCPQSAPTDMFDNYYNKHAQIKLFVRRVLITDQMEDLLPSYLNFIKGVVDSDDLPLNVSREQLQQHKILKVISKKLVRKILEMFKRMLKEHEKQEEEDEDEEEAEEDGEKKEKEKKGESKWDKFYTHFSKSLKLGCYEDDTNRGKIAKLLRFYTSKSPEKQVSLDKYVDGMKEDQDAIYYMAGESVEKSMKSPHLQVFKKRDLEVLFLTEQMDEPCIQKQTDFEGKKFISIQKGQAKLSTTDEEKKRQKKLKEMYEPLLKWFKDLLGDRIGKVELSKRLVEDPCTVVSSEYGYSAQMERVMKTQAFADNSQMKWMMANKIFEVNPNHPVVVDLLTKIKEEPNDEAAKKTAELLFHSSMIAAGYEVEAPTTIASAVYRLLSKELGVDPDAPVEDVDVGPLDDEENENEDEEEDDEEIDPTTPEGQKAELDRLVKEAMEENERMKGESEGGEDDDSSGGHDEL